MLLTLFLHNNKLASFSLLFFAGGLRSLLADHGPIILSFLSLRLPATSNLTDAAGLLGDREQSSHTVASNIDPSP
ncbi:hypothetical protein B0J14DRAFT_229368 [Halenospora varia]|nr:hypothetical protein B0J14DRAFT_229368 [Halenospora varia]